MFPEYLDSLYKDYIRTRSDEELMALLDYIVENLKRRKKIVYAKLVVRDE